MKKQPAITIRAYQPADRLGVLRCIEELQDYFIAHDKVGSEKRGKQFGQKYLRYYLNEIKGHQGKFLVARDGKTVVGFVFGAIYKAAPASFYYQANMRRGWIYSLYVQPGYSDVGLGSKLLSQMEAYFRKNKCKIIRIEAQGNTTKLLQFYRKRGYHVWLANMAKRI